MGFLFDGVRSWLWGGIVLMSSITTEVHKLLSDLVAAL